MASVFDYIFNLWNVLRLHLTMQFIHIYNIKYFCILISTRGIFESGIEISVNSTSYPTTI